MACPFFPAPDGVFLFKTIEMRRTDVLKELDFTEDPRGNAVVFSIKFRTKKGELVYLPRAVAAGLRMDMAKNRMRGVQPVDEKGNRLGHPTPMSIERIVEFNGQKVFM